MHPLVNIAAIILIIGHCTTNEDDKRHRHTRFGLTQTMQLKHGTSEKRVCDETTFRQLEIKHSQEKHIKRFNMVQKSCTDFWRQTE